MKLLHYIFILSFVSSVQCMECDLSKVWNELYTNKPLSYNQAKSLPQELWSSAMQRPIEVAATALIQRQGIIDKPNTPDNWMIHEFQGNRLYALRNVWDIKTGSLIKYWDDVAYIDYNDDDLDEPMTLYNEVITAYKESSDNRVKIFGTDNSRVLIYNAHGVSNRPRIINLQDVLGYADCSIERIILSPNNRYAAIQAEYDTVNDLNYLCIIDLYSYDAMNVFDGQINFLQFNHDSSKLYFAYHNFIRWYDLTTKSVGHLIGIPDENLVPFPAVTLGKRYTATIKSYKDIYSQLQSELLLFSNIDNKLLKTIPISLQAGEISLSFNPSETELLITTPYEAIRVTLATELIERLESRRNTQDYIKGAFYNENGTVIMIVSTSEINAYDAITSGHLFTYKTPHPVAHLIVSQDKRWSALVFHGYNSAQIINISDMIAIYAWFKHNLTVDQLLFLHLLEHFYKPHLRTSIDLIASKIGIPTLCLQRAFWSFPTVMHHDPELFYLIGKAYDIELYLPHIEKIQEKLGIIENRKRKTLS